MQLQLEEDFFASLTDSFFHFKEKKTSKDEDFMFWLNFFHRIMCQVDALYDQLQKREQIRVTLYQM
jgi:hypothetical protein